MTEREEKEPTVIDELNKSLKDNTLANLDARFNNPDVVVMDISMPVMDGLEATRQILADFPETRVLMLSSYDDEEFIKKALEAGASGYIVKEAIASELLQAIRSLYRGKRYFCREISDKVNSFIEMDSDSWVA